MVGRLAGAPPRGWSESEFQGNTPYTRRSKLWALVKPEGVDRFMNLGMLQVCYRTSKSSISALSVNKTVVIGKTNYGVSTSIVL